MKKTLSILLILALSFAMGCTPKKVTPKPAPLTPLVQITEAPALHFPADDPVALRMMLLEMPKGGDLHSHLSGIPYAEDYLEWAAADGSCVDPENGNISKSPCTGNQRQAKDAYKNTALWNTTVNTLSVRENRRDNAMWGHDHFFDAFSKFGAAKKDKERLLIHAMEQAKYDNVQYLELMISIYSPQWVTPWANKISWQNNPAECYQKLVDSGLLTDMLSAQVMLDDYDKAIDQAQDVDAPVTIRYINQIFRGAEPEVVFAQMAWSFELAKEAPQVVGLNFVGPEDSPIAVRDYSLHMQMLKYLKSIYPQVPVTLHAGEFSQTITTPAARSGHIREAVITAQAKRIGHGVDIAYEKDAADTLQYMRDNGIAIEVLLGSNDVILHVSGEEHPLKTYLKAEVPVVIATDDMGIARSTHTDEFMRAVLDQKMTYDQAKTAVRNSLEYSFLSGESLWQKQTLFMGNEITPICAGQLTNNSPDAECSTFLRNNAKAAQQWLLEKKLIQFERNHQPRPTCN